MKRVLSVWVILLMMSFVQPDVTFAKDITIEEAYQVLEPLWAKASETLGKPGWFHVVQQIKRKDGPTLLVPANETILQWYHINSEGLRDQEVLYRINYLLEEELIGVGFDHTYMNLAQRLRNDGYEPMELGWTSVYKPSLDGELEEQNGHEFRVEEVEVNGQKAILFEGLIYYPSDFRAYHQEQSGKDYLGIYTRLWFVPDTGFLIKEEQSTMMGDRTLEFGMSGNYALFSYVNELPENVQSDIARVQEKEFEGWTQYHVIPGEDDAMMIERDGHSATCHTAAGNLNGTQVWGEVTLQNVNTHFSGWVRSRASQPINLLGWNYCCIRNYCGDSIVAYYEIAPETISSSSFIENGVAFINWYPNCPNTSPQYSSGAGIYYFEQNGEARRIVFESPKVIR